MEKIFMFLATGFEETEAVATADILKRAEFDLQLVSVSGTKEVTGAHGITVIADSLFENTDFSEGVMLVLPGGMPGTNNLNAHAGLKKLIEEYHKQGKHISAICAAPLVLGEMGLLKGEKATSYPGFEDRLSGAEITGERVTVSGKFITGKGPGAAVEFGLKIVETLKGKDVAEDVAKAFIA